MQLVITGIHQRTTPVAVREQLAFDQESMAAALHALREQVIEACILSTCNRVEIYAVLDDNADPASLARFLGDWHALDFDALAPHVYTYVDGEAVRHLFRLAAGLDSMVLGEEQIMGQIRGAMQAAVEALALGPTLRRLIDGALAAGKLVRTKTGIARLNLSVVSVAVDIARRAGGTLHDRHVLIIGAGRMAELALKHLHAQAGGVTVISRTDTRAAALAERFGAHSAPFAELETCLATCDVVLSCTSAPGLVVNAAQLEPIVSKRETSLVLLDLAVPRDIDPQTAALPNTILFDVDAMQAICDANRKTRAGEVDAAEELVCGEVEKFMLWWTNQKIVPTIKALRERAEEIRTAELERTLARLPNLAPNEQAVIGALSAAIVNKLLHMPIASLKNPQHADELAVAVQRLFQL